MRRFTHPVAFLVVDLVADLRQVPRQLPRQLLLAVNGHVALREPVVVLKGPCRLDRNRIRRQPVYELEDLVTESDCL